MRCRVCGQESSVAFRATILKKHEVAYFHCSQCGFLQTQEPYWLEEAYKEPISRGDTGVLLRNFYFADVTSVILSFLFGFNVRCLDYAGGYGILTRLLRDRGFDCVWHDKYADNLFAKGFEYCQETHVIDAITCFEAFEHFCSPMDEIGHILDISKNVLFSTELVQQIPPPPDRWWYYGFEHGQHISFYSLRTLRFIANAHGLTLLSNGKFVHMMTEKRMGANLFSVLVGLSRYGLGKLPRLFMKSRTFSDMDFLSGRDRSRRSRR